MITARIPFNPSKVLFHSFRFGFCSGSDKVCLPFSLHCMKVCKRTHSTPLLLPVLQAKRLFLPHAKEGSRESFFSLGEEQNDGLRSENSPQGGFPGRVLCRNMSLLGKRSLRTTSPLHLGPCLANRHHRRPLLCDDKIEDRLMKKNVWGFLSRVVENLEWGVVWPIQEMLNCSRIMGYKQVWDHKGFLPKSILMRIEPIFLGISENHLGKSRRLEEEHSKKKPILISRLGLRNLITFLEIGMSSIHY